MLRFVASENSFAMDVEAAVAAISAGLGIIGLAHKAERAREEVGALKMTVDQIARKR